MGETLMEQEITLHSHLTYAVRCTNFWVRPSHYSTREGACGSLVEGRSLISRTASGRMRVTPYLGTDGGPLDVIDGGKLSGSNPATRSGTNG